jgi:hypothetical protein
LGLIKDKVYRYVSAEFSPKYEDPETGQSTPNVLVAVTLTNRPFIKRMAPILLAESGLKTSMLNEWELAQYETNLIEPERVVISLKIASLLKVLVPVVVVAKLEENSANPRDVKPSVA